MSFAPSSFRLGPKRKLPLSFRLAPLITVSILCSLMLPNEAGVIKKRDTAHLAQHNGNTVLDIKETEMERAREAAVLSTKLETINEQNLATEEPSKELTNNEISLSETKKTLEENVMKMENNHETTIKMKKGEENYKKQALLASRAEGEDQSSPEIVQTSTEFSTNDIREEKLGKFKAEQLESHTEALANSENSSSLENASQAGEKISKFYNGISKESEKPLPEAEPQNRQLDVNNSETSQENIKNEVKPDNSDKLIKALEAVTLEPSVEFTTSTAETSAGETSEKGHQAPHNPLETATESTQASTTVPLKDSAFNITQYQSNQILDREVLENQVVVPTTPASISNLDETTLKPLTKEDLFKKEHGRSLFTEEATTTTTQSRKEEADDEVTEVPTTLNPLIISLGQGIEQAQPDKIKDQIEDFTKQSLPTVTAKEKKPKFINDNSTNAQQLNLPNIAEAWSLAAMKALPKANITMETAQTLNQTNNKEPNEVHNTSAALSSNSEKNLLDWSQIMMDKELSSTTRNEDVDNQHEDQQLNIEGKDLTTLRPAPVEHFKTQPGIVVITQNSLIEPELTASTIPPAVTTTSTILSPLNYKENNNDDNRSQADKKVEENLNNHIDTLAATLATAVAANVDNNNPSNTSLNIEPTTLNETNLTSNPTQVDLSNDVHNKATADGEKSINDDDVNVDAYIQTSTAAAMPTTTSTSTSTTETETVASLADKTKATAVFHTTRAEQISSETTTVSTLETGKQNVSLDSGVISEQQKNYHKSNNVVNEATKSPSPSASHNELENSVLDSETTPRQYQNIDLTTKATITTTTTSSSVVPITTFRPTTTILATTSTTSTPAQEVDQNGNEIQKNLTNLKNITHDHQQSIIRTDLQRNHSETHLNERDFETTTTTTTTTTTLATLTTTAATQLTTSKIEDTLTSGLETFETAATTSSSRGEQINEKTTELNVIGSEATTTTQATPKQVHEHNNTGEESEGEDKEESKATTGSAGSEDKKFEKASETTTATAATTAATIATGTKLSINTTTETPVVIDTEGGKELIQSITPTTAATTTATSATAAAAPTATATATATTLERTTSSSFKQEWATEKSDLTEEDVQTESSTTTTTTTTAANKMNNTQDSAASTTSMPAAKEGETYISLLDDTTTARTPTTTTTTTTTQALSTTISASHAPETTATTTTATTTTLSPPSSSSTLPSAITTKAAEIYNVISSTTTELIETTTEQFITEIVEESSSDPTSATTTTTTPAIITEILPPSTAAAATTTTTTESSQILGTADIGQSLPTLTTIMGGNSGNMYPKNSPGSGETDVNVIIAITVSVIGVVALVLLVGFLYLMRKRQKQTSYSQRCRPVSLDEYTIDNASVSGSMRKSSALRASKRTYGNLAFDDPALRPNPMGVQELGKFVQEKLRIFEEFRDVPQITSRLDEVPTGCEDKNRYANVLPLPETRVILQRLNDDEKSEYINANYVTGPKDPPNYYIACQAPLESTVEDFWRMIWEQQSRVIIQATDLIENGVEKCAEYLPPSVTLDNHSSFGDFQITLQNREVKDKYAISTLLLKHVSENATRELTHYWYKWPEVGVPSEEAPIIAMLLEARSSLISYAIEQANEDKEKLSADTLKSAEEGTATAAAVTLSPNNSNGSSTNGNTTEINGNISMVHIKKAARNQGPLTIHCSPGTGRTGTIIACDIAIRSLETPKRTVDIPQIVYYVRRGRASAVLTKEQYEFIYKVANMYAAKITNPTSYN